MSGWSPAAADTQTTTFPFTEAVFNTCNNDLIVINGTETITTTITDLGGGRIEFRMTDKQTGKGSGLTGKRYTYSKIFTDRFTTRRQPLLQSSTATFITLKKVGGPSSGNMDLDLRETMTVNTETGEVVRVTREFEAECE